jgi:hypothetical protein
MANVIIDDGNLKDIANAIREKSGSTDTYKPSDMSQAILDIVSGGGANYTSITYNNDDTITLIDTDGTEHTMVCTYEDNVLKAVTYDGKAVDLVYDGEDLVGVGDTMVDVSNAKIAGFPPIDHTVTFLADGEPYEIVSVKNGNSVNAPATNPAKDDLVFIEWRDSGDKAIGFPFPITTDTQIFAHFIAVRVEIEYYDANTVLGTYGNDDVKTNSKANNGWSILGIQHKDGFPCAILVGLTANECDMKGFSSSYYTRGSVEYNGVMYYFCTYKYGWKGNTVTETAYDTQVNNNDQEAALALLKYYFNG